MRKRSKLDIDSDSSSDDEMTLFVAPSSDSDINDSINKIAS